MACISCDSRTQIGKKFVLNQCFPTFFLVHGTFGTMVAYGAFVK